MPDMIDATQQTEEILIREALSRCECPRIHHLTHCVYCEEALPPKHGAFCSAECRDDWEALKMARQRKLGDVL
jgi:predicted nucleic acid-binding Zn ribbon protein